MINLILNQTTRVISLLIAKSNMNSHYPVYTGHKNTRFPSVSERLLIQAAIGSGSSALEAWNEFLNQKQNSPKVRGENRLLPLVYKNIGLISGVTGLESLREIYSNTLLKNTSLSESFKYFINHLESHSIPFIFLKGFAIHLLYYHDLGLRRMCDIDFLVQEKDALRTVTLLRELGFSSCFPMKPNYP
ncbi:MAG: nucleotidyltransferase family protein, partial [Candidatus Staskawiczbacteria bacterium]|nr:nucleotidyltransferase family protein [Candidatus Staskawiczbacteria bacterium]